MGMSAQADTKEILIRGGLCKTAALRHEWCDFLDYAPQEIERLRERGVTADLFTFVDDVGTNPGGYDYHHETISVAALPVSTYEKWWDDIGFKPRNKIRKAQKSGVEVRIVELSDEFAQGVEAIYNESPIRQGRKFYHYGKKAPAIKEELKSFLDRSILVGAYFKGELIGFMKLFPGAHVLRTIHIIAKLSHREKCAMDLLIAKAVELCAERGLVYVQYGSWTDGGVGVFRGKHGFERLDVKRYFVPLNWKGRLVLQLQFHRPIRDRIPSDLLTPLIGLRNRWTAFRYRHAAESASG